MLSAPSLASSASSVRVQLVDKQRNAVRELLFRGRPFWPLRDLQLAPLDQFVTVVGQERMPGGTPF